MKHEIPAPWQCPPAGRGDERKLREHLAMAMAGAIPEGFPSGEKQP